MKVNIAYFNVAQGRPNNETGETSSFSILGSLIEDVNAPLGSSFVFLVEPDRCALATGGTLPPALQSTALDKAQVNQLISFRSPKFALLNPPRSARPPPVQERTTIGAAPAVTQEDAGALQAV